MISHPYILVLIFGPLISTLILQLVGTSGTLCTTTIPILSALHIQSMFMKEGCNDFTAACDAALKIPWTGVFVCNGLIHDDPIYPTYGYKPNAVDHAVMKRVLYENENGHFVLVGSEIEPFYSKLEEERWKEQHWQQQIKVEHSTSSSVGSAETFASFFDSQEEACKKKAAILENANPSKKEREGMPGLKEKNEKKASLEMEVKKSQLRQLREQQEEYVRMTQEEQLCTIERVDNERTRVFFVREEDIQRDVPCN